MNKIKVVPLLLVWFIYSPAQVTPNDFYRFHAGQWTKEGFLLSGFKKETLLVRATGKVRLPVETPDLPEPPAQTRNPNTPLAPRRGGKVLVAHEREFFTLLEGGTPRMAVLWEKDPAQGWIPTGRLPFSGKAPVTPPSLFPLGNGKVLAFNADPPEDCRDPKALSPFSVLRRNDRGELSRVSEIDPGIPKWQFNRHLARDFAYLESATVVEDHLVVCGWNFGLFWVFDLEDGRLKRLIRLFDAIRDDEIIQDRNHEVVINFQPTKDRTLLVAARPEDSVKALGKVLEKADAQYKVLAQPAPNPEQMIESYRFLQRERDAIYNEFAYVTWFEVDPLTGSKRRLEAPHGAKELLPSRNELDSFFWIPDELGHLRFVDRELKGMRVEEKQSPSQGQNSKPPKKPAPVTNVTSKGGAGKQN